MKSERAGREAEVWKERRAADPARRQRLAVKDRLGLAEQFLPLTTSQQGFEYSTKTKGQYSTV